MLGAWLLAESTTGHDAHSCGLQQLEGVPARGSSTPPSTTAAVQLDYIPIQPQSHNALCIDEHGGEEEGGVAQRTMCPAPYPRPAPLGLQRAA